MDPIRHLAATRVRRCTAVECPFADRLWGCRQEQRRRGPGERGLPATAARQGTDTASVDASDESSLPPDRRSEIAANDAPDLQQNESLHARPDARYRVRKDRRVHTCGDRVGVAR